MMSILIKSMKMPKGCRYCPFKKTIGVDKWECSLSDKQFDSWEVGWGDGSDKPYIRHKDCPLLNINLPNKFIKFLTNKNGNEEMSKVAEMEMAYGEYLND